MRNKTELGYYCEDDFAQTGEALNELTVTITLCEYRNLIREQARSEATIDALNKKVADLEKTAKGLAEALKNPSAFRQAGKTLGNIFCSIADQVEYRSPEDEDGEGDEE